MPNLLGKNLRLCFPAILKRTDTTPTPTLADHPIINTVVSAAAAPNRPPPPATYSDDDPDTTPDFAALHASDRFFFSSPGRSNSIIDSSPSSSSSSLIHSLTQEITSFDVPPQVTAAAGAVPVHTFSPDPYSDFRRSMQEMVEAHDLDDWDYLHDLLLCYLSLNPKSVHGFIIQAFVDFIVSLVAGGGGFGRDIKLNGGEGGGDGC